MIKLVIFDLWQTLIYRDEKPYYTLHKIMELIGEQRPIKEMIKLFENSVQTEKWGSKYDAYSNLCKNLGLDVTEENVNILIKLRDEAESNTKMFEHVEPMLKQLREKGYKIGLISNSSVFAVEQVRKLTDVLDYIDYPLFSFDVGVIKPDLKFFKEMLKRTGFKAEECVMIGDKMDDDVLPPRELGMNSIHYTDYEQLKKDLKDLGVDIE